MLANLPIFFQLAGKSEKLFCIVLDLHYLCTMIKALFFDIDGTLVSFKTHVIPDSAVKALEEAHHKGIKIFIATGRPKAIINNMSQLDDKGLIDGYVTMNGAYCFVGDKVVFSHPIPHESVVSIGEYAKKKGIACIFVPAKGIRVCNPDEFLKKIFYENLHVDHMPVVSFEEGWKDDIYQITPFFNTEQETEALKDAPGAMGNRWHPGFTDITAVGVDKCKGVQLMTSHFGIKQKETMCFGDGGNDISMLTYAGIGVALGNAEENVKRHADYVTTHIDEDGVAKALKHFDIIL